MVFDGGLGDFEEDGMGRGAAKRDLDWSDSTQRVSPYASPVQRLPGTGQECDDALRTSLLMARRVKRDGDVVNGVVLYITDGQ